MQSFALYAACDSTVDELASQVYLLTADDACLPERGIITLDEQFMTDFPRIVQVSPTVSLGTGTASTFLIRHAYDSVVIPEGTRVATCHAI